MEESPEEIMGSNDHIHIVKGKRTKRQRVSSSPLNFTIGEDELSTTSDEFSESTEEEEEMANCLILLAQGNVRTKIEDTGRIAEAGLYVYECKTCNRSFPSFQALGGHRASHKKQKKGLILSWEEDGQFSPHTENKSRVHECSICGSEFSSGQALGGHMRRHRTITTMNVTHEEKKPRNVLSLDLNLPAPDDDHRESKFPFASNHRQLVALLDCHY